MVRWTGGELTENGGKLLRFVDDIGIRLDDTARKLNDCPCKTREKELMRDLTRVEWVVVVERGGVTAGFEEVHDHLAAFWHDDPCGLVELHVQVLPEREEVARVGRGVGVVREGVGAHAVS